MTRHPLRRGALAVIAESFPEEVARGRRVLVLTDDSPDPQSYPGSVLVSFEEQPALMSAVHTAHLLPLDDRPCVTGDPRCCLLEPCPGCVLVLRAHLGAALQAGGVQGPAGEAFVRSWNDARAAARTGVRETTRQAREFALAASVNHRPLAEVVAGKTVTAAEAQEVAGTLLQEDAEAPAAEPSPEKTSDSADEQPSPPPGGQPVEKSRVTRRRPPRRKDASPDVASPEAAPPAQEGETTGGPLGAEAPAGPRGG